MSKNEVAREKAVNELKVVYQALFDDVAQAEDLFAGAPSDFAKRSHVRAYFAYVEGLAEVLRHVVLVSLDGLGVLTDDETDELLNRKWKVLDSGERKSVSASSPMKRRLLSTLRYYPRGHGINNYEPELGAGWNSMVKAIRVRNRVTHPKSVADLTLSEDDIAHIDAARQWWHESVQAMLGACEQEDGRCASRLGRHCEG